MVLTGCRESGTLVRRDMALLCLAGEVLLCLAGKALLFLRIEPPSLCDRPDMRCSVCSAGPPGSVRREAGFLLLAVAREALSLLAPRDGGAAAGRDRCRGHPPGPGSLPARTAPPEETRRAGRAPAVPVPVWARPGAWRRGPASAPGPAAPVQASHGRTPFSGAVPYSP